MGEDACSVAVQFSAALLFSSSERGLMALGINGEVISRAYALGPARGGWGLCATACTPTWVFVRAHVPVWMRVRVCLPSEATHNRRAWLTAKNPERSKHSGKQMHSGTIRTPCVDTALPAALLRDVSLLARRQSANNQTKKEQNYWCSAAFFPLPPTFWLPYMFRVFLIRCLMKLHVWRIHFSAYKPRGSEPITVSSRSNRTGPALPSSLNSSCIQDSAHRSVMQRCSLHQQGRRLHSEKGWVKYCWQVILFI